MQNNKEINNISQSEYMVSVFVNDLCLNSLLCILRFHLTVLFHLKSLRI